MKSDEHAAGCRWPGGEPCRQFSTDGTRLGADIAHTFDTTDEDEIIRMQENETRNAARQALTGVREEQADWEADDEVVDHDRPGPYPNSRLDFDPDQDYGVDWRAARTEYADEKYL